jgi:curved DNA-binding protein
MSGKRGRIWQPFVSYCREGKRAQRAQSMSAANEESLYAVLGVAKTATHQEIQSAFKKKARELHPDVNKAHDAEEKFKRLVQAYEVLKDQHKRERYDAFGIINGKASKKKARARQGSAGGTAGSARGPAGPTDGFSRTGRNPAFDDLFDGPNPFDYILRRQQKKRAREREVQLSITLEHAFNGTTMSVTLEAPTPAGETESQRFKIKIPPGAKEGDRLKLKDPNVIVVLKIEPNARYEIDGRNLSTTIDIAPWEAVLGTDVEMASPSGATMKVKIPPGTSSGQRLRLRGLGLPVKPGKDGEPGDMFVRVRVVVPKTTSEKAIDLWRQLAAISDFNPRS